MYDEMVKNAYEEICGIGKEAKTNEYKIMKEVSKDPKMTSLLDRATSESMYGDPEKARKLSDRYNKKYHNVAMKERMKDAENYYDTHKGAVKGIFNRMKFYKDFETKNPDADPVKDPKGYNKRFRSAALDWEKNRLEKKWGKKHLGDKAEKAAEKAAAYYDEAQYIKEAAESDYAEACAYEDAAIQILDELGYLD